MPLHISALSQRVFVSVCPWFIGDNPTPDFAGSLAYGFIAIPSSRLRACRVAQCKRHD